MTQARIGGRTAIAGITESYIASHGGNDAVSPHFAYAVVEYVADEHVAHRIKSHARRLVQVCVRCRTTVAGETAGTVRGSRARHGGDDTAAGVQFAHAIVEQVAYE